MSAEVVNPDKPAVAGNEEREPNVAAAPAPVAGAALPQCPPHNTMQLLQWLQAGESDKISEHFIRVLEYLDKKLYVQLAILPSTTSVESLRTCSTSWRRAST